MRVLRWIPLIVALIAVYYFAARTKEIKDAVVAQAPGRLGIRNADWNHWSHLAQQIHEGHMPDLNDKDWESLKKLYNSADSTLRDHAADVIKLLEKTQYKDKAESVTKG